MAGKIGCARCGGKIEDEQMKQDEQDDAG